MQYSTKNHIQKILKTSMCAMVCALWALPALAQASTHTEQHHTKTTHTTHATKAQAHETHESHSFAIHPYFAARLSLDQASAKVTGYQLSTPNVKATYTFDGKNIVSPKFAMGAGMNLGSFGVLRAEVEYASMDFSNYQYTGPTKEGKTNEEFSSQVNNKPLSLNLYFDFKPSIISKHLRFFQPYVEAGFGGNYASITYHFISGRYSVPVSTTAAWKPTWNVGAGVGFRVSHAVMLDVGYRYTALGTFKDSAGLYFTTVGLDGTPTVYRKDEVHTEYVLKTQEIVVGARYVF